MAFSDFIITLIMSGNMEDKYADVEAGKASLTSRIGWITRTASTISMEIDAFNERKSDRGAKRLEDLVDIIGTRFDKLQLCADWINTQAGVDEKAISSKVDTAYALVKTSREEITTCLKGYAFTPAPPDKVNNDNRTIHPISDLKPEKLHLDDNPCKLCIWEENFLSYFNASNVDIGDAATQQNFLCSSLDTELVTLLKQRSPF